MIVLSVSEKRVSGAYKGKKYKGKMTHWTVYAIENSKFKTFRVNALEAIYYKTQIKRVKYVTSH
jgi:hypothetical protein